MNCAGSVRASASSPTPHTSSYAQEGTAAHALAELSLRGVVDPSTFLGQIVEGVEVTEEMCDNVRVYVAHCRTFGSEQKYIEHKFSLEALDPPRPMFGTADFVAYDRFTQTLTVVDLKYGKGVLVEVEDNPQLKYYALGAALTLPEGSVIDRVVMTIVQPRASHADGPIRSAEISYDDLCLFASELIAAAHRTMDENAPLKAGKWCRFCPASGNCSAQRNAAQLVAQTEFDLMPVDKPPMPDTLPDEVFWDMMAKKHILEDWLDAMTAAAYAKLERGEEVKGWKLVEKRANRRWANNEETVKYLAMQHGMRDEMWEKKLKSPAQIEKIVGRKVLPDDLLTKESSGFVMVRDTDTRPAVVLTAGSEFPLLSSGGSSINEDKKENRITE